MAKSQIPRYIWLIDLLYRHGPSTHPTIAERWLRSSQNAEGSDYPKRTFHNDRDAIAEIFGISILCNKQNGYKYYIETPEDLKGNDTNSWILSTLSTIQVVQEGRTLKRRILIEPTPRGEAYLPTIIEAMKNGRKLQLSYSSYWSEGSSSLELSPYCIKNFRRRWYLVAYPSGGSYPKIYALDRVSNIELSDTHFVYPPEFDAEDYFHNSFGIMVDEDYPVEEVTIKAYGLRVKYLEGLPLHHNQRKRAEGEDWAEFSLRLRPSYDFQQEVLSYGDEIEVLSPEWLREDIRRFHVQAVARYE